MAKPDYNIKVGPITLAVWTNTGTTFDSQSVTITRTYKKKDGTFDNTPSLRFQDLPLVKLAIDEAMKQKYLKSAPDKEVF